MEILSITPELKQAIQGRLSDGSDRRYVTITNYIATIEDNDRQYVLIFSHEPTEQEVQDAFDRGEAQEITTIEYMAEKLADARRRVSDLETFILQQEGII